MKKTSYIGVAIMAYSSTMLLGAVVIIINATMVPLSGAYGVDLVRAGLLISAIGVGRIFMQVFGGMLVDRLGRKAMCLAGQAILLLFFVTLPFSNSFWLSAGLCALAGAGYGMLNTASLALIFDCFAPSGRNAVAQSYVQVLFAAGGVLTPLAANRLLEGGLFWGNLYWGCAVVTVVMIVLTLALKFPPAFVRTPSESGFARAPRLLREGLILCLLVFAVYCMGYVSTTWLATLASQRLGFSSNQAVLVLSLYSIGSICGALVYSRLLRRHHALPFMILNPAMAMVALTLPIFLRQPVLFLIGVFFAGGFIAIEFNMGIGLGGEMFSQRAGTITGMISTSSSISSLLTPMLTGLILDRTGNAQSPFYTIYLLGAAGVILGLVLRARYRKLKMDGAEGAPGNAQDIIQKV